MRYLVAIGSNQGDRLAYLQRARQSLPAQISCCCCSPVFESPALGGPLLNPDFLNAAWILETSYGPHHLLYHLLSIEQRLGRVRSQVQGPRRIDLDLILAESGEVLDSSYLRLPHPQAHLRRFVLAPACCIAGDWQHPILGLSLAQLYDQCPESPCQMYSP